MNDMSNNYAKCRELMGTHRGNSPATESTNITWRDKSNRVIFASVKA